MEEVIDWDNSGQDFLLTKTVPVNNFLLTGTVPVNNSLFRNPLRFPYVLAGHASGCWLSALGAGVPYNREKKMNENLIFFSSGTFFTLFPSQQ